MRILSTFLLAASLFLTGLTAAVAQDDKGFLTNAIQNALSSGGRTVSIDGFRGALSSEASFDRMTIADTDGVWLTLEGVVLDWEMLLPQEVVLMQEMTKISQQPW